ncbi:AraC family transcriptional regulator [Streptacidiphilus fuscans]|uniref:AraC family transcriptional regulator n=1 Tax=Streptacidiphilus fuscans TaxID=2789292 RepID=A0A931B3I6_9ACTN|nr:AraC family transcriptional regulator [Streptacidiphilus fuscans]MBF9069581.1 AraC family transcriptional regulator [Streptacidiphilus fuscans]
MDILSDALSLMRTARPASVRTDGCAPWALRLPPVAGAGFHVVLHGTCWLLPAEDAGQSHPPLALAPGDVVFLRSGSAHVLADHPDSEPVTPRPGDFEAAAEGSERYPIGRMRLGGAGGPGGPGGAAGPGGPGVETSLLCGNYHLDQARPHPLLAQFPELIHLPARPGRHPELSSAVQLLCAELERPRLGTDGIVAALIDALLLYILRAWLDEQPAQARSGWLAALSDPAVAPALAAMHGDPAEAWTVQSLADQAGLSRAAFARRFTTMVGEPPLAYLTRWRMTRAAAQLREDAELPLSAVATRAGYGSEFAFGKAFKREYGVAPGAFRRELQGMARPAAVERVGAAGRR